MTASLAHRGPDDSGEMAFDGVYLGHRRLTVIDLSPNGHQPMSNEDGSVWITYNGELYGTDSLRDRLISRGHVFRSRTDTEVLIHLYEEEGERLFSHVNGMFAFAIYDCKRRRLLLARDRLGVKPLFYSFSNSELLFGSEMKAVLAGLGSAPSLRVDALAQYMLQGYVSTPDTIFEGIQSLPPGHYLLVEPHDLERGKIAEPVEYWDAPFTGDDDRAVDELSSRLEQLLSDAVRVSLVADVPLGAFLSGGIDSGTIVGLMARASESPVRTFTVDVPGTDRSERRKALLVAQRYKTFHTEVESVPAGAEDYWTRLGHFDSPFNCASLLNAWLVSRVAREHVTVALSGDGGDELFAGYARYGRVAGRKPQIAGNSLARGAVDLLPRDLRGCARFAEMAADDFTYYFTIEHSMPVRSAEQLAGASLGRWVERMRAIYERYPSDALTRAMYFDVKTYLADHILAKVDSASMAVSLEVRVPFLDYRVVELAGRIPSGLKLRDGTGKWILKRVARRLLPEQLIDQKKVGFDPPLSRWVFDRERERCLDELSNKGALFRQVFDGRIVDRWIERLRVNSKLYVPRRAPLWAVYQLEQWMKMQKQPLAHDASRRAEYERAWQR
jgi:asparagine synthase (glutamine-hydrolysing)